MTSLLLALAFATGTTGDTGTLPETDTASPSTTAPGDTATADTASTDTGSVGDTAPVTAAALAGETGGLGCDVGRGPMRLGVLVGLVVLLRRRGVVEVSA